jgi:predicted GNAT family N-acyltransferase
VSADRFTLTTVPAAEVIDLRHRVLRTGRPESEAHYDVDDQASTVHIAAIDADGTVIACATFFPEPFDSAPAWRLRGMATDEAHRGRGLGSAVLRAGITHVASRQGRLLWCNARAPALSLYQRAGFVTVGEEFDVPGIGPHYRAVLQIELNATGS